MFSDASGVNCAGAESQRGLDREAGCGQVAIPHSGLGGYLRGKAALNSVGNLADDQIGLRHV